MTGNVIAGAVLVGMLSGIFIQVYLDSVTPVYAEADIKKEPREVRIELMWTKEAIIEQIAVASKKYGVSYEKMYNTVACESGFVKDIQSHHVLSYGREQSYGVSQFHIPSGNRNAKGEIITKEMALDPIQALDAMAYHFSVGNAKKWTCFRDIYL